ncbi:MAG: D-tyrosyl-tRNA(Tyr) deacylase [Pseudohongiellaceae bacterium]|jgi:D-tyrosyl-tRNA(Tyr) deacylase
MIALIQRVNWAQVHIDDIRAAEIGQGILALVGIEKADTEKDAEKILDKLLSFRMFSDSDGKMNLDVKDIGGDILIVSQFTLAASTEKGQRPSFSAAKEPEEAEKLYDFLVEQAKEKHEFVETGQFGANMEVALENDGPVTFILRS